MTRFLAHADRLGVPVEVREFPAGTRTAQDAAEAIGCDVAQIVKSLVFIADGRPVLALTSGRNRVDEGKLGAALGASEVRKADANEVRDATGYAIGGTPPFGHATDLEVVCDRDLTAFEEVWAAAGTPSAVFGLTPRRLLDATGAEVIDLAVWGAGLP
jgi:Cys-tRNA(Pro) deacylase